MKKVAFLGIPGSFSYIAANKYFGRNISGISCKSIKEVFSSFKNHGTQYGVVPVENSTTGSILATYDELMETKMNICGEILLKIHHHLLVWNKKVKLEDIKKCYSHPQAISQCESFLNSHKKIIPVPATDTATAAHFIAQNKKFCEAALASGTTAEIYGLKILKNNIEDNKNNFTRFVIINNGKNKSGTKASIAFSVKHIPGSLFKALRSYASLGLNLTKIESRPLYGKAWEYIFFVDFEINNNLDKFNKMIKEMKEVTEFVTVLGIYNKGETYET